MKIIITNDDGLYAEGLVSLVERLSLDHEILVAGPHRERSATSHSVTIHERILVHEEKIQKNLSIYAVEGTPADCIKWAVSESGFKPDWIVSGVNRGANTGISLFYSGTVAAAREGAINGIPSLAVSLCSRTFEDFKPATEWAAKLLDYFGEQNAIEPLLLNLSIPPRTLKEIRGLKLARQAPSRFIEEFLHFEPDQLEKESKSRHYQLAGGIHLLSSDGTGDEELMREGWATLTPLSIDQTDYKILDLLRVKFGKENFCLGEDSHGSSEA